MSSETPSRVQSAVLRLSTQQQISLKELERRPVEGGAVVVTPRSISPRTEQRNKVSVPKTLRPFSAQRSSRVPKPPVSAAKETVDYTSPSERVGLLESMANIRTKFRDARITPVTQRRTFLTGPPPPAPVHQHLQDGVPGNDPQLSHFLDPSDFDPLVSDGFAFESSGIAYSKYHSVGDGQTCEVMEPCKVVGFDSEKGLFSIRWIKSGKTKLVRPLMLRFHGETDAQYQQRVDRALYLRDEAESMIRLREYILSRKDSVVTPPSPGELDRILQLVAQEFPRRYLETLNTAMDQADSMRAFGLKRAVVRYGFRDPQEWKHLERLRLFQESVEPPPDLRECRGVMTLEKRSRPFAKFREFLGAELFHAHPSLYRALRFAINRWFAFNRRFLIDVDEYIHGAPFELVNFRLHQAKHNESVAVALRDAWMNSIVGCIQSELSSTFNFFEDNLVRFNSSRMFRFLRMLHLCLGGQLQGLIYESLEKLEQFVKGLRLPPELKAAVSAPRDDPIFLSSVGCVAPDEIMSPKLRFDPDDDGPAFESRAHVDSVIYGVKSLLTIRLEGTPTEGIHYSPSLEEIEESMWDLFDSIFRATDNIADLTKVLFPLLTIDSTPLTKQAQETRATDSKVNRCKELLSEVVEENLKGPRGVLDLYLPFQYLLTLDVDEWLRQFLEEGEPELKDYDAVCERLQSHIDILSNRSFSEIAFPLVRIETYQLKNTLKVKAQQMIARTLTLLIERTNQWIEKVSAEYSHIYTTLLVDPTNPDELKELRDFVDRVPVMMNQLADEFDCISDNVQLLGKYGFMPNQEAFEKYWDSVGWPRKVEIVMDDIPFRLQSYRAQFLSQLRDQTEELQLVSKEVGREVAQLSYQDDFDTDIDKMVATVDALESKLENLREKATQFNAHERLFQLPITRWVLLKEAETQFAPYGMLWRVANESRRIESWLDSSLEKLKPEEIVTHHTLWTKDIQKLNKSLVNEPPIRVVHFLKERLENFRPLIPLITALAKQSLLSRRRHVAKIGELVGVEKLDLQSKSLQEVINLGVLNHVASIQELSEHADHEFKLEKQLGKMKDIWQRVVFKLEPHEETFCLKETDTIRLLLDDSLLKAQTMLASPYSTAILNELQPWEQKLSRMSQILDEWLQCQFGYTYLAPIFASEDFAEAMPNEARAFEGIHAHWTTLMEHTERFPYVLSRCSEEKLLPQLQDSNTKLDKLMRELAKFLDTKRLAFPRFFFLSNEDLIEILSETKDPTRIQPHVKKCFEGMYRLVFDEEGEITTMISSEKEEVELIAKVVPAMENNVVEKWLGKLEQTMLKTVRQVITDATTDYARRDEDSRVQWTLSWPGQAILCASMIHWTNQTEESIRQNSILECLEKVKKQLGGVVQLVRGELSPTDMATLQALVVLQVHARDIVAELLDNKVESLENFLWKAQLRYYHTPKTGDLSVQQTVAKLPYGFEYLGNSPRLVITPLTDRCYRTLTAAYHLHYGGAPEGPAGTGKTETTKDLAKAIGKQCVVYNCSEQIKAFEMEKMLRGLAACGAWGCFDEFNRIELQVLSVIAQQVLTIQLAVSLRKQEFFFEEKWSPLREGCSIFITMNPGYAGRAELPDNLKALFRPVAMMVPDYALIAENSLFSCGFLHATSLSKKIVATYKLCSEQLSSQPHYDYGMRAVKSVLIAAQLLRGTMRGAEEASIVVKAVTLVNEPKFLANDAVLFRGIIADLFGDAAIASIGERRSDTYRSVCENNRWTLTPTLELKMNQFYEMMLVRHGVMVVGGAVAGKTTSLKCLATALTELGETVEIHSLNPKSVSLHQLYGKSEAAGAEWQDGILSRIFRQCATDESASRHWLLMDGPVDALWIENMNTVLDDNKKLCLTNGDIIRMTDHMSMVFVVEDLFAASPATVSRCGMVYYEPSELGWAALLSSWLSQLPPFPESIQSHIESVLSRFIPVVAEFVAKKKSGIAPSYNMLYISFLQFLTVLFEKHFASLGKESTQEEADLLVYVGSVLLYAVLWTFGAALHDHRDDFEHWLKSQISPTGQFPISASLPEASVSLFHHGLVVPSTLTGEARWVEWTVLEGEAGTIDIQAKLQADVPYHEIIVPTPDSLSYTAVARELLLAGKPFLIVGSSGVGKSMIAKTVIGHAVEDNTHVAVTIQCSAQTTPGYVQTILESKIERRGGSTYGPPADKHLIVFIDDMGMPEPDRYGTRSALELVRQMMTSGGMYSANRRDHSFHEIVNTTLLAAMQPITSGRGVSQRLLRHFHVLSTPPHTVDSLKRILASLLDYIVFQPGMAAGLRSVRDNVIGFCIDVFCGVQSTLLPTPDTPHYVFNFRHILRVLQGVVVCDPATVRDDASFYEVVAHESLRVFGDPLFQESDRAKLWSIFSSAAAGRFKMPLESLLSTETLMADFLGHDPTDRPYLRMQSWTEGREAIEGGIRRYNEEAIGSSAKVSLVVFDYVVSHVAKVCRIIQQPFGSALLVGLGGTGRRSCGKLAAIMANFAHRVPSPSSRYNRDMWRDDLATFLRFAGEKGNPTVFLFADTNITEEPFLEDVSNLLNSGEIPGLFGTEAVDSITENLRTVARQLGKDTSRESCWDLFVMRCRTNAHIVMCFSPAGSSFRVRLRRFPSLMNCASIDYFESWPRAGLLGVAKKSLTSMPSELLPEDHVSDVASVMVSAHLEMRNECENKHSITTALTPTRFFDLLETYKKYLDSKTTDITSMSLRYRNGLHVIEKTEHEITEMQAVLEKNAPILEAATHDAQKLIEKIDQQTAEADKERSLVAVEEAQADEIATTASAVKEECEEDLAEAMPAMNAATDAVTSIDKRQLVEIRSMQNPTDKVKKVLEAVCVLLEVKPKEIRDPHSTKKTYDYWAPARTQIMSDVESFRDLLLSYDKENMKEEIFEHKIQPYIHDRSFKPEAVANVSKALVGLCNWVIAMEIYYRVQKKVKPKQLKLAAAEAEYRGAMAILNEKKAALRALDEQLDALKKELDETVQKRDVLQEERQTTQTKLTRAMKILVGFANEKVRYGEELKVLQGASRTLVGDCLLAALIVCYLGPFAHEMRMQYTEMWRKRIVENTHIVLNVKFSIEDFLSSSVTILKWRANRLPSDPFSTESAIMMVSCNKSAYAVDPQGQCNTWLKCMDKSFGRDNMVVLQPSYPNFQKAVVDAVQNGYPLLIENCGETIDPFLTPILMRQVTWYEGKEIITLGDATIPFHPGFKLYMTSKIAAPHFLPEESSKITIVAFFVTESGLKEQALQHIIQHEQKELEDKKNRYVEQGAQSRAQLKQIEDVMLEMLSSGQNLLESDDVIIQLESSKKTSTSLEQKIHEIEEFNKSFEKVRQRFIELAGTVSALFFVIVQIMHVDAMYRFSLLWYLTLLDSVLSEVEASPDISQAERIQSLHDAFLNKLYSNTTLALFAKHQQLFSLLLAAKITGSSNDELFFMATGGIDIPSSEKFPERPFWLSVPTYTTICRASAQLKGPFQTLARDICHGRESEQFQQYITTNEEPVLPLQFTSQLTPIQQLVLVRCLRIDQLGRAVNNMVISTIGESFLRPTILNVSDCLTNSKNPAVPLVFLLSPGGDPLAMLRRLAEERGMSDFFDTLSLGAGTDDRAKALVENGSKNGRWVLLQNCHLYPDWMPQLELLVEGIMLLPPKKIDRLYRLWLTSMPCDTFPEGLLQVSVKMVVEPPSGVRSNLLKTYTSDPISNSEFFESSTNPSAWKRLCYGLCLFHAVVQGRREFGSLGWNVPYEFNDTDLRISLRQIHFFASADRVQFDTIQYLVGECNYGGRVTDVHDRLLLKSLLTRFVAPKVLGDHAQFDAAGRYTMPPLGNARSYTEYIEEHVVAATPSLFGLHDNADITKNERDSRLLLDSLVLAAPKQAAQAGSSESQLEEICNNVLSRIRSAFDMEEVRIRRPVSYSNSMNTVLVQELQRFNRLINAVRSSVAELAKAVRGEVVLSNELDEMRNAILVGRVPPLWSQHSYPSLKPFGAYVSDLEKRLKMFSDWIDNGPPVVHWLGGYYFPQSFATGVLQEYCRANKCPIDALSWTTQVLKETPVTPPEVGCYISGLYLEGASWDYDLGHLMELPPRLQMAELTCVWLSPVETLLTESESPESPSDVGAARPEFEGSSGAARLQYSCPVYRTMERRGVLMTTGHSTNFIMHFDLDIPATSTPDHWIQRGTAIITSLNY